jgi:ubiquinol-cytochrome c reductase cytochrome b subunit
MLVLVLQIVTGIFLTMHYKPDANLAFGSVEYIMREVPWGWLVRYMHSTGASAFFIVVYLHMTRGAAVRFLPQAARTDLAVRLSPSSCA